MHRCHILSSDAQAVHDETIKYDSQAEVTIPPAVTMETNSLPIAIETDVSEPVVIVEVTAPPTEAVVATPITSSTGDGLPVLKPSPTAPAGGVAKKPKSPILLYKWSFKVMTTDIVVLLGYKRYVFTQDYSWFTVWAARVYSKTLVLFPGSPVYIRKEGGVVRSDVTDTKKVEWLLNVVLVLCSLQLNIIEGKGG